MYEKFYKSFRPIFEKITGHTYKLQGRGEYRLKWITKQGEIEDEFYDFDDLVEYLKSFPELREAFDEHTGLKKLEEEYYGEYTPHEPNYGFMDDWELAYQ
jgi:hypothetical protein